MLVQTHGEAALAGGSDSAPRDAARNERDAPERMCIVTRERHAPENLIRFVLGPDATVVPDIKAKLPGRGVWVTARAELVEQAVRRQAFARGLKANAKAAPTLPAEVDALLERDCLQSLSLANKAGAVVTGFTKVEAAIENRQIALILHANDASAEGARKVAQALRRKFGADGPPEINLFASCQLDLALGRANVVHAALKAEPASRAFLARCRRLAAYRSMSRAVEPREIDLSPEGGFGVGNGEGRTPGT
ncbi:MAG TPA: RNA-binding protein [Beijerinckiaceae bacterium]|nr:RNA-binding protein [Beijerinckiaceae bacterium]